MCFLRQEIMEMIDKNREFTCYEIYISGKLYTEEEMQLELLPNNKLLQPFIYDSQESTLSLLEIFNQGILEANATKLRYFK
jgi:hypothetical protein